jgi:hypothetical protein
MTGMPASHSAHSKFPPDPKQAAFGISWRTAGQIALVAVCFTLPFLAASWGGSLEHNVCARVLAIDEDGTARVDYWWDRNHYTKSIASDETFKPAGQATVSLYFVGSPEDAIRGHGGGGPYTTLGILCYAVPFLLVAGLVMAGCRSLLFQRVIPAVKAALDFVICRWGKEPTDRARVLLFAAIAVICMGTLNVLLEAKRPRSRPDRLARAFLAAVHDGRMNKAAYLVDYDDRYAFVTDSPSWVLLDYKILEAKQDLIRYQHTSEVGGRRIVGESMLPVVNVGDRYWVGHLSLPDGAPNQSPSNGGERSGFIENVRVHRRLSSAVAGSLGDFALWRFVTHHNH